QPRNFAWEIADSGSVKSVFKAWDQRLSSSEVIVLLIVISLALLLLLKLQLQLLLIITEEHDLVKRRQGKNVTAIDNYEIAHYCEKKKMVSEEAVAVLVCSATMYFV
nr:hypothetical protein [Tanacetum cinerariifolium]